MVCISDHAHDLALNEVRVATRAFADDDVALALRHFHRAARLYPASADIWDAIGACEREFGRDEQAVSAYRKALLLRPDDDVLHHELARTYQDQGCAEDAIQEHQIAIRLDPDQPKYYADLASLLIEMGQEQHAILLLRKALSLKPEYITARACLALAYLNLDDPLAAHYHLQVLDRFDPAVADQVRRVM